MTSIESEKVRQTAKSCIYRLPDASRKASDVVFKINVCGSESSHCFLITHDLFSCCAHVLVCLMCFQNPNAPLCSSRFELGGQLEKKQKIKEKGKLENVRYCNYWKMLNHTLVPK